MSSLSDVILGFIGIGFFAKNPKKKIQKDQQKKQKNPNPKSVGDMRPRDLPI